ncbi:MULTISPECIES: lysophospholipid acyltransferase family protein [unclassified Francisella]|uniref:lysophospholipid acyltransferase family protein n=1 Tax=unclassified Francisella TaxID=2610885 RepID=UPI002E3062D2|nr:MULTISPECIES: lysophospholipid acyltransferase family protein [unclassified Francisella]MED7820020.1 lysophospholipid acyltransferase family protein [Francisella sp. 19S2-4]MED7830840.1 lysophospholipid acyltransferase family protein [Francisella sp. 19S2-10]
MRSFLKKIWNVLMWIRMTAFQLYSFAVIGGCSILINIFAFFNLPISWRMAVCYVWTYLYWIGMLVFLQVYIRVTGKVNIDKDYPCIYVSKHQSMLETFMFYGLVGKCHFIMKQELFEAPVFGPAMKNLGSIAIDREKPRESLKKVVTDGKQSLADGVNVVIFPEGTRVEVGEYPEFQRSAMKLASDANVFIIPVAHNFGRFFPKKWGQVIKPGIARMDFGKRIDPHEFDSKQLTSYCHKVITEKTKEFKG